MSSLDKLIHVHEYNDISRRNTIARERERVDLYFRNDRLKVTIVKGRFTKIRTTLVRRNNIMYPNVNAPSLKLYIFRRFLEKSTLYEQFVVVLWEYIIIYFVTAFRSSSFVSVRINEVEEPLPISLMVYVTVLKRIIYENTLDRMQSDQITKFNLKRT